MAHEIGHSMNMKHDGDQSYDDTKDCDPKCCIMTPFGAGSTFEAGPTSQWSSCSNTRYQAKLLDLGQHSCLTNDIVLDPIDHLPGKKYTITVKFHFLVVA